MVSHDNPYHGLLLFHKPVGITSHDAVDQVRNAIGQRRIGHTGTLDPLAEGLLVMCVGRFTKIARFISGFDKTYEADIRMGITSETYDAEGVTPDQLSAPAPEIDMHVLRKYLEEFKGLIKQRVPAYSAVRIDGQRLYKLARQGAPVDLPEREVEIKDISLLGYDKPYLHLRLVCSKGTYVRSLAHDLGNRLGCGGYLSGLRRTTIGSMNVKNALTLTDVSRHHQLGTLRTCLLEFSEVLNLGAIVVTDEFAQHVISGKILKRQDVARVQGSFRDGDNVVLRDSQGKTLAIGAAGVASELILRSADIGLFKYIRVLN